MSPLRVGFAGTPAFAARALEAIARAGYTIPLVLSQPDRPKGRGLAVEASPVKALAGTLGVPVLQPATLKTEADRAPLLAVPLDVLVVAAYGLILPPAILAWPRHGCLNIHASKLPRWRGAAPIPRAIEAGDASTGVTIMRMDEGLDTGPMVDVVDVPIRERETAGTLHDRLAEAGAAAILEALSRLARRGRRVDAAARRGRELRREDRPARRGDRLDASRRRDRPPGARLRPGARRARELRRRGAQGLARAARRAVGQRRARRGDRARGTGSSSPAAPTTAARCASSRCSRPAGAGWPRRPTRPRAGSGRRALRRGRDGRLTARWTPRSGRRPTRSCA